MDQLHLLGAQFVSTWDLIFAGDGFVTISLDFFLFEHWGRILFDI